MSVKWVDWVMDYNEHNWHACAVPPPPDDVDFEWHCPVCEQHWIWRRPPRPAAQWIRRDSED